MRRTDVHPILGWLEHGGDAPGEFCPQVVDPRPKRFDGGLGVPDGLAQRFPRAAPRGRILGGRDRRIWTCRDRGIGGDRGTDPYVRV